ncbi:hypothetical protein F4774DRAFT_397441 [Daldinia eschscholtzii]|nr:hypothetical protein F4774DRAFT_397441 [Daldinia eschscholtzii]
MAQGTGVELNDDEIIALYFDIDGACCPSDVDSSYGSLEDFNTVDQDVVSSIPNRKYGSRECIPEPWSNAGRTNFSGGQGCYAWRESPYVMMGSEGPPSMEVYDALGISWENWLRQQGSTGHINEYRFPSEYAGIDWAELIRECYEVPY